MKINNRMLLEIFETMDRLLEINSIKANITIYGGALMTFLSDDRPMTRDVDAIVNNVNDSIFKQILHNVEVIFGLDKNWFNSDVSEPLKVLKKENIVELIKFKNLIVLAQDINQMLAMKILSARSEPSSDFFDAKVLCDKLNVTNRNQVISIFKMYLTIKYLGDRQLMFIEYLGKDLGYDWK